MSSVDKPLVLVVDDIDDNREIYCSYLEAKGFRTVEARDGVEAIERTATACPAVVVMDLAMPILDGWEATRRIRELPNGGDVYIIVVSGHATRESRERAFAAGCDDFVAKPCLPADLARRITSGLAASDSEAS